MMRVLRIIEAAASEAEEAVTWYEQECPGLGLRFAAALDDALRRIELDAVPLSPVPGKAGTRGVRRMVLQHFPYDVVVFDRVDARIVVAFAHHSRRPGYWRSRIKRPA
ncbi:type II toxin-antitoxin system RelE/ParE family toxin [Pseudazoarcus pumilus]|nr:type II toxin-antitoxin system RelE/ParE family toxin [Pseudazoarcus pumilus]